MDPTEGRDDITAVSQTQALATTVSAGFNDRRCVVHLCINCVGMLCVSVCVQAGRRVCMHAHACVCVCCDGM